MKNYWTDEEEKLFMELYQQHGNDWNVYKLHFPDRSAQSIKCKYHNEVIKQKKLNNERQPIEKHFQSVFKNISQEKPKHGGIQLKGRSLKCTLCKNNDDKLILEDNEFELIIACMIM